ncbi:GapA-binding peptide SR1P [Paenibacillus sp. Soil522]|uniref:GapA-binding peptide SR1P n=1 Tax=Paenibacillus sp. Soil522 TaxID=1736388 RepID=UPI0007156D37|nr:GapA-binding peptide SR1P [Paenibacillus sp. Soil522]KRE47091.1 hypothetical protein ASG81_09465 [Paenibacillus sp. Soil522]
MGNNGIDLGVIICKHCMSVIDTLPTERVTTYYSDCQEQDCLITRGTNDSKFGSVINLMPATGGKE